MPTAHRHNRSCCFSAGRWAVHGALSFLLVSCWTLGQAVTFFDNDFAGRIAQKQMQVARSLTEVIIETVNAVLFALASVVGAAFLVSAVDPRLLIVLACWFATYVVFLRVFLPLIRARSKARAGASAMLSGQVVDTITNIKTVKLFAGTHHETDAAQSAMQDLRHRALEYGSVATLFRFGLITLAGVLPITMVGFGLAWRDAGVTPGDLAAIGAVSIRLSQMTGWVSFVLMAIFSHVGEGMVTQETAMFNRSARDNIVYGKSDATDDQLIAASQKADKRARQ